MFSFLLLFLCNGFSVLANEIAFGFNPNLEAGEKPALILTPDSDIRSARVQIEAGGKTYTFEKKGAAGEDIIFEWKRDSSITEAMAHVYVVFADGYTTETQIPISYSYGSSLEVDLSRAKADHKKRTLTVRVNAPVENVEMLVYGPKKVLLDQKSYALNEGPGEVTVSWDGDFKDVVLLDITFLSGNSYAGFTYSPWYLNVPHQDILFATNSAHIEKEEEWKLDSTMEQLKDVLDKYGSVVPVKLYIGGCTDTVGSKSSNKELSRARARSIAKWLRANGYDQPIFYYGFGEDWLAVPTKDGVNESSNRRVEYIVSTNPPPASTGVPQVVWKELR